MSTMIEQLIMLGLCLVVVGVLGLAVFFHLARARIK